MSEIDWSKAPEGATHCTLKPKDDDMYRSVFWRVVDGKAVEAWPVGDDWSDQGHFEYGPEGCSAYLLNTSVERPSSSWTGTGLPPVGMVCEIQHESLGWTRCEIVAHKVMDSTGVTMAIAWIDANTLDQSQGIRFRPIRTQAQIEAEDRERALQEIEELITGYSYGRCAEILYQAGYRKQGEGK